MNTETIKYFLKVVNAGSINKAAAELYLNHQHLGKRLSALEKEIGLPLLIRDKQGVSLTKEGEYIHQLFLQMADILDDIEGYVQEVKLADDKPSERDIYFFVASSIHPQKVANIVQMVSKRFPHSNIFVEEHNDEVSLQKMYMQEDSFCNIIASDEEIVQLPKDINILLKRELNLVAYVPISCALAQKGQGYLTMNRLLTQPIALYSAYDLEACYVYQELSKYGKPLIKRHTTNYANFYNIMLTGEYTTVGLYNERIQNWVRDSLSDLLLTSNAFKILPITYKGRGLTMNSLWCCRKDAILPPEAEYFLSFL